MASSNSKPPGDLSPPQPAPPRGKPPVASDQSAGVRPRTSRVRRAVLWSGLLLACALVLVAIAVAVLLSQINHPAVKRRVIELTYHASGLHIDYEALKVSLTEGVRVGSFTVASPQAFRPHAPHFAELRDVEILGALWALPWSRSVDRFAIGSANIAIVTGADGSTSLQRLFPPSESSPEDKPLSHALSDLPELEIEEVAVSNVRVKSIDLRDGEPLPEMRLEGVELRGVAGMGESGLDGTDLSLRASVYIPAPVPTAGAERVQIHAQLSLNANAPRELLLGARAHVVDGQAGFGVTEVEELLDFDVGLQLLPEQGQSRLTVQRLLALDEKVSMQGSVLLPDSREARALVNGSAQLHLESFPVPGDGGQLVGLSLEAQARELSVSAQEISGDGELSLKLSEGQLFRDGARLAAQDVALQASVHMPEGAVQWQLSAASLSGATEAGPEASSSGVSLRGQAHSSLNAARVRGIDRIEAELEAESVRATLAHRDEVVLTAPSLKAQLTSLTPAPDARFGWSGQAKVELGLPSVRAKSGRDVIELREAEAQTQLPLSLSELSGALRWKSLKALGNHIREADLEWEAQQPLSLPPGEPGQATVTLKGRVGALSAPPHRSDEVRLRLQLRKLEEANYRTELWTEASGLRLSRQRIPGSVFVEVSGNAQADASAVQLQASVSGSRGAKLAARIRAGYERPSGKAHYNASLSLHSLEGYSATLAALAPELAGLRLDGTRLSAEAHGELAGVLRLREDGPPEMAVDPMAKARGQQQATLRLERIEYRDGEQHFASPEVRLHLESQHRAGGAGNARLTIGSPKVELRAASESVQLEEVAQSFDASFEQPPHRGQVELRSAFAFGKVSQSAYPAFPVEQLTVSANASIDRVRSVLLRELRVKNPATGTNLVVRGAMERAAPSVHDEATLTGRQAVTFKGQLEQQLQPLAHVFGAAKAVGRVTVPFQLQSGDLLTYRLNGKLVANGVSYESDDGLLLVDELTGRIPFEQEIILLPSGPVIAAGPRTSPLKRERFFDVQPFLPGQDYVSLKRLRFGGQELSPVAGNIRLQRSLFAIDQFQAGYAGGKIAGQVRVDYRGGDPIVHLRVNLTGVQPRRGEGVLDANAALTFVPNSLSLEGKMQIVRISRDHLLGLLDTLDPFHETVNVNKVRLGLKLGYPKFVRLSLHDGVVDTKVELGGLSRFIRIDEIQAVPLGPLMQRFVAPVLSPGSKPEPPAKPLAHAAEAGKARDD